MDESELEPDPHRRKPALLWLILALVVIVGFAAIVFLLFSHPLRAVGPPPGAP